MRSFTSYVDLEVTDPLHAKLTPGDSDITLAGIINAPPKYIPLVSQAKVLLQVPLRTGTLQEPTQSIVEIMCDRTEMEPKFCQNWTHLQFAIIKNCIFKGKRTNYGLDFFVFTVTTYSPSTRFIWLSSPRRDFWMDPVPEPENPVDSTWRPIPTSGPASFAHGVLDMSPGSVIGKQWCTKARNIHTDYLYSGMVWGDFCAIVQKMRRDIVLGREVVLVDGTYNHKMVTPPLMHQ